MGRTVIVGLGEGKGIKADRRKNCEKREREVVSPKPTSGARGATESGWQKRGRSRGRKEIL